MSDQRLIDETLERAAKLCEKHASGVMDDCCGGMAEILADKIRALKGKHHD